MRPVGVILVFLNLLFSIATCALIVVVYTTRANWKKEYDHAKDLAEVAAAAYKSEKQAHENDLKGRDELVTTLNNRIEGLKTDASTANAAKEQLQAQFDAFRKTTNGSETQMTNLTAQVAQVTKELDSLKAERQGREGLIIKLEGEKDKERKDRVETEVKFKTLQDRNSRLAQDFAELSRKYDTIEREFKKFGGSAQNSILTPDVLPAPRDVTGSVLAVNERGLTEISLGTDSGVKEGNTLYLVRYNEKSPKDSIYLGTLKVSKSEPKKAIGYFEAAPTSRIKLPGVGDYVMTSLMSK